MPRTRALNPVPSALAALAVLALRGCAGDGPAIGYRPQTIRFGPAPSPAPGELTALVSATASSGLPVRYSSATRDTCAVDPTTGRVTATGLGTCTIAADQSGNERYAPAPQVTQDVTFLAALTFSSVPSLSQYDRATIVAVDPFGRPAQYASSTPSVCAVDADTGLILALTPGDCIIVATAGTLQATRTLTVSAPSASTLPGAPSAVTASAGDAPGTVTVRVGATAAGGSPIRGYTVSSSPPGIVASAAASPIAVTCPSTCAGHRFSVTATNATGTSPASLEVDVVTSYRVVATFHEPETQPNDSVFVGSYTLDATTGTVSDLHGRLSESMTGGLTGYPDDTMTWLSLTHQLSSVPATLGGTGGLLVTTFLLESTDTLSASPAYGGTDGWAPGTGRGLHHGVPGGPNPGNAYVRIFVSLSDPTAALTQAQIDKLAYADCSALGMMGSTCMTGTTVAGYGTLGTMSGYPVSQITTRQ